MHMHMTIHNVIVFTVKLCILLMLPYHSGKFSLMQIFADLPSRPSEETFVVLNYMPALKQDHITVIDLVLSNT